MADFTLNYTGLEVNDRLGKVDQHEAKIETILTQIENNEENISELEESIAGEKTEREKAIDDLKAQGIQQTPIFVDTIEKCTDTSKLYVLPDGYIYAYKKAKTYRNWLLEAEDTDGNYYNNGQGWKAGYRLNSSGAEYAANNTVMVTGFIPFKVGDVLRFKNVKISGTDSGGVQYFAVYNSSKANIRSRYTSKVVETMPDNFELDSSGNWLEFDTTGIESSENGYDYGDASYFRIAALGFTTNTIITINEKIEGVQGEVGGGEVLAYEWQNTGHAFVPADYEERILALETMDSKTDERITELEDEVKGLKKEEGQESTLPDYWVSHLDERCDDIRQAMESAGRNKSSFFWYNDAHWNYNSGRSPLLLEYLYQHTPINQTNFGGDIVNNEPTELTDRETMKYLWKWRDMIRDIPNHHSAIGNHDDGNTTDKIFPENYIYAYLLAPEENNDIVIGDGFYYYIDNKSEKTRYLYLDTAYEIYKDVSSVQLAFVTEALKNAPENWHIVAIAHVWHNTDYTVSPPVVSDMSTGGIKLLALFDNYNARVGEFSSCTGRVEFCIGGHCHIDHDSRSDGGIPIILTETDSSHVRSGLGYTIGTITESSVNAIVADYGSNNISVIRIGRGSSRNVAIRN